MTGQQKRNINKYLANRRQFYFKTKTLRYSPDTNLYEYVILQYQISKPNHHYDLIV